MPGAKTRALRQTWEYQKKSLQKSDRLHTNQETTQKHGAELKILQRHQYQH